MDLFDDMAQAVRFAYCLEAYREAGGALVLVQMALKDAGLGNARLPVQPERLVALRTQAHAITRAIHGNLLRIEAAGLTAAYSRNWDERRTAVIALTPYFYHTCAMKRTVGNPHMFDKLVARHYIAERERGAGWDLGALSAEFKTEIRHVRYAASALTRAARDLESVALNSLREALGKPAVPKSQQQGREVAHA